jgi:exosortase/archaeosortase
MNVCAYSAVLQKTAITLLHGGFLKPGPSFCGYLAVVVVIMAVAVMAMPMSVTVAVTTAMSRMVAAVTISVTMSPVGDTLAIVLVAMFPAVRSTWFIPVAACVRTSAHQARGAHNDSHRKSGDSNQRASVNAL